MSVRYTTLVVFAMVLGRTFAMNVLSFAMLNPCSLFGVGREGSFAMML
jgi:hypothetical protein